MPAQPTFLLRNVLAVNEGRTFETDVLIRHGRIDRMAPGLAATADHTIEGKGKLLLLPGLIDDQVHFRQPGLTHKGDLFTESRAAVAGGVTSYMEMPNTVPPAITQELLADKYRYAAESSAANYAFYIGAGNHNLDELRRTDPTRVPGIKIFMGSSTGDLLVDDPAALEGIFQLSGETGILIATHCEDEPTVRANTAAYRERYGADAPARVHPEIRNAEACYLSSSKAVALAKRFGSQLHILHISTARELELFQPGPLKGKKITAEACTHHLWFSDADYDRLGNRIKWNPAVKTAADRDAIWQALRDGRIDVLATDHAPHTIEEKAKPYFDAPSGGPLVQHTLQALMDCVKAGRLSVELLVEKACHAVADRFGVVERGYLREGYHADLVLFDPTLPHTVTRESLLYKCGWSPFEGHTFSGTVVHTFVNGHLGWSEGRLLPTPVGQELRFTPRQ